MAQIGEANKNDQELVEKTAERGTDYNQYVWHLRCLRCGHEYGANGSDFHLRKCPRCQGGAPGLAIAGNPSQSLPVTAYNPPGLWQPFGPFSQLRIQGEGRIVHLKGQVALDREGAVVGAGDMRAQLRQVLENIKIALASVGGEIGDIFSLTQYATDMEAFMQAGDIRRDYFAAPFPVTTTIQVMRLYRPEMMVEIAAVAEIPLDRFRLPQG